MALTQVPIELSSTPGIVDNSNDTAITIDSSENVLVGKTSAGSSVVGQELRANGYNVFTRDGDTPLELYRKTSDGSLLNFTKDGTGVGSIGCNGAAIHLASGTTGIRVISDNTIRPSDASGSFKDNAIDLGASNARWKDLYLSGEAKVTSTGVDGAYAPILRGVYSGNSNETNTIETAVSSSATDSGFKFNVSNGGGSSGQTEGLRITRDGLYAPVGIKLGGTGSANLLDDYEEGSWTPVYVGSTTAGSSPTGVGTYTKVGRLVTVTANFSNVTASGAAGNLHIDGLPFTAGSASNNAHHGATTISALGSTPLTSSILISESEIRLRSAITSIYTTVVNTSSIYLYTTITYETNE